MFILSSASCRDVSPLTLHSLGIWNTSDTVRSIYDISAADLPQSASQGLKLVSHELAAALVFNLGELRKVSHAWEDSNHAFRRSGPHRRSIRTWEIIGIDRFQFASMIWSPLSPNLHNLILPVSNISCRVIFPT